MIERERTCILLSFYTRVATTWMYLLLLLLQFVVIVLASLIIPKVYLFFHKKPYRNADALFYATEHWVIMNNTWTRRTNNYTSIYRHAQYIYKERYLHMIKYKIFYIYRNFIIFNEWIIIMYWFLVISNSHFMCILAYLILIFLGFPILDCRQNGKNILQ